jgi:ribonuclease-3
MVETEQAELEAALGYHFRNPERLLRALTHSSLPAEAPGARGSLLESPADNEQLEFLGDAVLGLLVGEYLVAAYPHWSEGQLSKSRARLVNANSLCDAARRLRLGGYLRLGRGEEKTGGREKPALLADAYEAILAAVYLDGGLEAAREFVRRSLLREAAGFADDSDAADAKSALQELLQRSGRAPAEYRVVSESGPHHRKEFIVEVAVAGRALASAGGVSKKEAEKGAAHRALQALRGEPKSNEE